MSATNGQVIFGGDEDGSMEVEPHSLCHLRSHVVDAIRRWFPIIKAEIESEESTDVDIPSIAVKHHASSVELQTSATAGCHQCNLIWDTSDDHSREMLRDFESEMEERRAEGNAVPHQS